MYFCISKEWTSTSSRLGTKVLVVKESVSCSAKRRIECEMRERETERKGERWSEKLRDDDNDNDDSEDASERCMAATMGDVSILTFVINYKRSNQTTDAKLTRRCMSEGGERNGDVVGWLGCPFTVFTKDPDTFASQLRYQNPQYSYSN